MIPLVEEYMRREVEFIDGEDTLSKAVGIFREKGHPIIVVLSNSKTYMGVVTDRIVLRSSLNLDTIKAKSVVLKVPLLKRDDTVVKAARLMLENTVKGLPVSGEDKSIIGIITVDDVGRAASEKLYSKMKVREVMTSDLVTVSPDSTIGKALVLMRDNGISRIPVVKDGKLVGLVTIRDIIEKVLSLKTRTTRGEVSGEKIRTLGYKVSNIMTKHVVQSTPEENLTTAIKKMIEQDISCLVVTHSNRVVGILTWTDILEVVASLGEKGEPPINIQVSFKIREVSRLDKSEIIKVAEKYVSKLGEALGTGHLLLHFKEHREKHGEDHLIHCRARLRTDKVDLVGIGEAWTASQAARVALDKIERKILTLKELSTRYTYADELVRSILREI
ncbi:MAG: CBS domain-containing protein [Candidatus Caldarchaeales archaeon]